MRTAIAIRHIHFEDLGHLEEVLRGRGFRVEYREAGLDSLANLSQAELLVVLGGPIGVYDDASYPFLKDEIAAVAQRLDARRPTLGICLGAQIIAKAMGKAVYPSGVKELGWAPVTLTDAGRASVLSPLENLAVLHWHGDTFDLPEGAELLASTPLVKNQAFSIGNFALGLQFHLEVQASQLERWYIGHAGEIAATEAVSVEALRNQAALYAQPLVAPAQLIFADWLKGARF
ncbi:MAG TPA: glutamine amidotransferase [Rhodospirillaceae bacterium]|nr:glutamine amidotransferase [Rhodospirillaceae bacterium]